MNQLMENGHKPVPFPDDRINDLPRGVLDADSMPPVLHIPNNSQFKRFSLGPLLGKDCQVCQDTFAVPTKDEELGMLTTVTLPCKHCEYSRLF